MTDAGWLARLEMLRGRPARRILGLNSGTSVDGIDVALVEVAGTGARTRARLVASATVPYEPALAARLRRALDATTAELTELHVLVGAAFADAAVATLARHGVPLAEIDLVGSHGQTVCHLPRSAGYVGATLQIGESAILAERLGAPVVCDFRARDVAAGGEGAPLVPFVDYVLFHRPGVTRAVQNIGGIGNVTVVPDRLEHVVAFDTGPGNMALDEVTRLASGGVDFFDRDGARAARGVVDEVLLAELAATPFFAIPPPRTTGREAFGVAWLAPLIERHAGRLDDLLATLTRFTALSIRRSYDEHVRGRFALAEVLVSGGGVHNATLMAHLAELLAPLPVRSTGEEGVDPDAKEALAFAVLANQTLFGLPGNLPSATGAAGPRVLGKIVPP